MERFQFSEFPINGAEFEDYCYSFSERYGEDSTVFKTVDEEFIKNSFKGPTWCDALNDLRERLINRGFTNEVEQMDLEFEKEMRSKLSETSPYCGETVREIRLRPLQRERFG